MAMRTTLLLGLVLGLGMIGATAPGQVQIHEFVAKNVTGIQDEMNEYEDWLEIANLGVTAFDLSEFYLTDDLLNPTKWKIPQGTIIPPGGTLLVWADEDGQDGPYHANFKLDKEGEEIGLVAKDGITVVDSVQFGQQTEDMSTGRIVGQDLWVLFPVPTPRALNRPEPCGNLAIDGRNSRFNPGGQITAVSGPRLGQLARYQVVNAPAGTPGVIALATLAFHANAGNLGVLLVHPATMAMFPIATGSQGTADFSVPVPNVAALAGVTFYLQAFVSNGTTGGFTAGLITRVCI
jgi:hypothetical protein